jgi:hypothetical protein
MVRGEVSVVGDLDERREDRDGGDADDAGEACEDRVAVGKGEDPCGQQDKGRDE